MDCAWDWIYISCQPSPLCVVDKVPAHVCGQGWPAVPSGCEAGASRGGSACKRRPDAAGSCGTSLHRLHALVASINLGIQVILAKLTGLTYIICAKLTDISSTKDTICSSHGLLYIVPALCCFCWMNCGLRSGAQSVARCACSLFFVAHACSQAVALILAARPFCANFPDKPLALSPLPLALLFAKFLSGSAMHPSK